MTKSLRAQSPALALHPVLVTRSLVDAWRREAVYPVGRIGVFFGVRTSIHFVDGVSPLEFDFYPMPNFRDGVLLLDRGVAAYRAFRQLHPGWEIVF